MVSNVHTHTCIQDIYGHQPNPISHITRVTRFLRCQVSKIGFTLLITKVHVHSDVDLRTVCLIYKYLHIGKAALQKGVPWCFLMYSPVMSPVQFIFVMVWKFVCILQCILARIFSLSCEQTSTKSLIPVNLMVAYPSIASYKVAPRDPTKALLIPIRLCNTAFAGLRGPTHFGPPRGTFKWWRHLASWAKKACEGAAVCQSTCLFSSNLKCRHMPF